ncbi:hypothetical protein BDF20DRAFT_1002648 [Mycotypha africana]|uniref:uncharacterized protein n=1 Tax=Mycotypha africana TaxID=64632 RepID=UPI0023006220|nr:uncharacterized protein BDF20DRAFT_1002648 [Mycotypha africana]KAI8973741.1 hypothetical protein BDF20DRAFT_1002648 [Mycotypha africana]
MLDKLPQETLNTILSQLQFADKLNLATTCHYWYRALSQLHLYQKLEFGNRKGDVNFPKLYRLFSDNPSFGEQTTSLRLNHHVYLDSLILASIPRLFPNVRHLQLHSTIYTLMQPATDIILHDFKRWQKLTSIDIHDHKIAFLLLRSRQVFDCLTHLSLDLGRRDVDILHTDSKRLFQRVFAEGRTPAVKTLYITNAYINLEYMELLHEHVPKLEKLILSGVRLRNTDTSTYRPSRCGRKILVANDNTPREFVKAPASSDFTYVDFDIENESAELTPELLTLWLLFFAQKYDNNAIKHFEFDLSFHFDQPRYNFPQLRPYFIHLLSKLPKLKHFTTAFTDINQELLQAMDHQSIQLNHITCYATTSTHSHHSMAFADFCEHFANSAQAISLRTMDIECVEEDGHFSIDDSHRRRLSSLTQSLTHLTHLIIDAVSVNGSIWVTLLQNPPPQLTHLDLMRINSNEKPLVAYRTRKVTHSPIRHLSITLANFRLTNDNSRFLNRIFKLIIASCPNIRKLHLIDEFYPSGREETYLKRKNSPEELVLDLTKLDHLKELKMRMCSARYYVLPLDYQPLNERTEQMPPGKNDVFTMIQEGRPWRQDSYMKVEDHLQVSPTADEGCHYNNTWFDHKNRRSEGSRDNNRPFIFNLLWAGQPKIELQRVATPSNDTDDEDYWIITPFLNAINELAYE